MTALLAMESATTQSGNMSIPAPPSAEKVQRTDRDIVAKMVGHLHIAATTLTEGRISTGEKIKHEIKKILHAIERKVEEETALSGLGMPMSYYGADKGVGDLSLPNACSVQSWSAAVDHLIPAIQRLPVGSGSLPVEFKKRLAGLIKDGRKLCGGQSSVSEQARDQVKKAEGLYARLSGAYFL
jgi:hypothetical protein